MRNHAAGLIVTFDETYCGKGKAERDGVREEVGWRDAFSWNEWLSQNQISQHKLHLYVDIKAYIKYLRVTLWLLLSETVALTRSFTLRFCYLDM